MRSATEAGNLSTSVSKIPCLRKECNVNRPSREPTLAGRYVFPKKYSNPKVKRGSS